MPSFRKDYTTAVKNVLGWADTLQPLRIVEGLRLPFDLIELAKIGQRLG